MDLPVQFITANKHCDSNYHKYAITIRHRANFVAYLRENNIDAQMHYTDSFNAVSGDRETPMPMSEKLCTSDEPRVLTDTEPIPIGASSL